MSDLTLERAVAMAICRVQYNGMNPDTPAVRWNGTEMEPQDFPAWRDFLDEARAAIAAGSVYQTSRAEAAEVRVRELEEALRTTLQHFKLFTRETDAVAKAVWDLAERALSPTKKDEARDA